MHNAQEDFILALLVADHRLRLDFENICRLLKERYKVRSLAEHAPLHIPISPPMRDTRTLDRYSASTIAKLVVTGSKPFILNVREFRTMGGDTDKQVLFRNIEESDPLYRLETFIDDVTMKLRTALPGKVLPSLIARPHVPYAFNLSSAQARAVRKDPLIGLDALDVKTKLDVLAVLLFRRGKYQVVDQYKLGVRPEN